MKLPSEFVDYTRRLLGKDLYSILEEALHTTPPVSVRLNTTKFASLLQRTPSISIPVPGKPLPWATDAFYLKERPAFTFDPFFHSGMYYVQEASSMFLEQALRQYVSRPAVLLDLCAAPGGKSTLIRSVLPSESLLVSNEPLRPRARVLAENMIKWGDPNVVVTHNYPSDFTPLTHFFDVIVTDVPCSGEGMFRKDDEAISDWSTDNVALCWKRQREILSHIWPTLKPGGILVYSTCTYNQYEDEENVAWVAHELGAEVLPVVCEENWNVEGNLLPYNKTPFTEQESDKWPVYHFLPGRVQGEGFFMAVLRKRDSNAPSDESERNVSTYGIGHQHKKHKEKKRRTMPLPEHCKTWVANSSDYHFFFRNDTDLLAFPRVHQSLYQILCNHLTVLHAGIAVAELKGKDWIPSHGLAMNLALEQKAFPVADLSYEQAVSYLRKEALTLSDDVPKGYVLILFRGIPLGFAKNIGNRANNLYPQEWRIRSGYVNPYCLSATD